MFDQLKMYELKISCICNKQYPLPTHESLGVQMGVLILPPERIFKTAYQRCFIDTFIDALYVF